MSIENLINKFNEQFPVGATVPWRAVAHDSYPYQEYTVSHSAYDHHGMAVCFFKERSGFVSIDPKFVDYGENSNG